MFALAYVLWSVPPDVVPHHVYASPIFVQLAVHGYHAGIHELQLAAKH